MKLTALALVAFVGLAGELASMVPGSGQPDEKVVPVFGVTALPPGYRDWRLISVAHEEGDLNDIRAILGNDAAIKAYREGMTAFPDGTIIARLAWKHTPSEENNTTFGRAQSFVAGAPVNGIQFMVKDSKAYASTGGWAFAQFDDGKPLLDAAKRQAERELAAERQRQRPRAVGRRPKPRRPAAAVE